MAAQRVEVDAVEDAHHPVATANAPDGIDAIVAQRGIEVVQSRLVARGEVAVPLEHVCADDRLPSERARIVDGARDVRVVDGAGWRDERDACADIERSNGRERSEWHESVFG